MFCKNCGKELAEGTKFCDGCGASQVAANTPAAAVTAPVETNKGKNNTKVIIIAAVAVVCFVLGYFVIAPSFTKDTSGDTTTNNPSQSQEVNDDAIEDEKEESSSSTAEKKLAAIDGGYNKGKMFSSDLGEYGKVSLSVGYNPENGVVRQVAASFTVTVRHSEYASMKSDFEIWEERISNGTDKNVEASFVELSESVSFIIGISKLNEADRADRVALAEEILDFVADEEDYAFYVDDLTTLLVDTYGFTVQE